MIANQILRSATSMAANYRAVGRARSKAEFVAKIGVVVEEADETVFWLEMLADSGIVPAKKLQDMLDEANQLMLIFIRIEEDREAMKPKSASKRTAKE